MSLLYFCTIFLMFIQIEGSRSNKETSISPCAILLRFFHPIRKLNGCVSTLCFFLYANRGFHVEICAKTRVSLHSQLHSNYVVFALLLYECRTVAVKKNAPTPPPEVIYATILCQFVCWLDFSAKSNAYSRHRNVIWLISYLKYENGDFLLLHKDDGWRINHSHFAGIKWQI